MNWKIVTSGYGGILIAFSFWFWYNYRIATGAIPFPPITTVVTWIGVISMWLLMADETRVKKIFGENPDGRKNILNLLGMIFTAFILMITILWGLAYLQLPQNVLYVQSYLLVGLFFYIVAAFYCILIDL
jgi:uncharacterized membrane protein